jgi:hypothetical protein
MERVYQPFLKKTLSKQKSGDRTRFLRAEIVPLNALTAHNLSASSQNN